MDLGAILQRGWEALLGRSPRRVARVLWLGQQTVRGFVDHEGPARAATIAYYAFFSMFPLILFLIAGSGYFLEDQVTQQEVYAYFEHYIPQISRAARANVEQILAARDTISLVAVITLLWSASSVFSAVSRAINRAWGIEQPRPFWKEKLLAVVMVLLVSLLLLSSTVASAAFGLVSQLLFLGVPLTPVNRFLWSAFSLALPPVSLFVLLGLVYRFTPNTMVRWRVVWPGAALATLICEVVKDGFTFYLTRFARYDLVYGQVEAFIVLLLYFYFVGAAILVGAELTAVYAGIPREDDERVS